MAKAGGSSGGSSGGSTRGSASAPGLNWELPPGSMATGPLDACEFDLVRQAVSEALATGEDCEIEQMVRLRSVQPVRRRVQVRLDRDLNQKITTIRIVVERDGEPTAAWMLTPGCDAAATGMDTVQLAAINAFTAMALHAEAVKRHIERNQLAEISGSLAHIVANAHRAWQHVGSLCRERAQPTA